MRELPAQMVLPPGFVPPEPPDPPAVPRDAATVLLVRDRPDGLEVFLQHRVRGMPFAGGMTVFPGGGVDARDADTSIAWTGPQPDWWAARFGCDTGLARALVCAAVRETFEEAGVLLAAPASTVDSVVEDTTRYHDARARLVDREMSLAQFLAAEDLVLRADLLSPWANWLTPIQEPRRYDTRFFVAALPAGQRADDATSEAEEAGWQRPADAIADWEGGKRMLLPPTWVALADLAELDNVAAAMAAQRTITKITPTIVRDGEHYRVVHRESALDSR